jgi:diaminohydroxyphosphoribosylaminopyrimidine deaminase/5-amino-6-(5-phosphoribosylamino)uracil reductase
VIAKVAQSLDGRMAVSTGDSKWISGDEALKFAHKLRAQVDAILVGKNTVLKDNPELTVRLVKGKNPLRIVLDTKAELSPEFKVFEVAEDKKTVLVCSDEVPEERLMTFMKKGVTIWKVPLKKGRIDLRALMEKAHLEGITSLLVEGGGKVHGAFLEEGLIDEVFVVICPLIIGDSEGIFTFQTRPLEKLSEAIPLYKVRMKRLGKDYLFSALTKEGLSLLDTPLEEL